MWAWNFVERGGLESEKEIMGRIEVRLDTAKQGGISSQRCRIIKGDWLNLKSPFIDRMKNRNFTNVSYILKGMDEANEESCSQMLALRLY